VLRGRFKEDKYYKHFMNLVKLLKLCLAFEINEAMLNEIDNSFRLWVKAYEKQVPSLIWYLCSANNFVVYTIETILLGFLLAL
jgi:hypothetical protein